MTRKLALLIGLLLAGLVVGSCSPAPQPATPPPPKSTLVVFAADSLIKPFEDLAKAFMARYPNIDVQSEYHGSIQVIRHVTELHVPIDVAATADYALIPPLMYSATVPETGRPYATSYIRFATNALGLAYTDKSKYAGEINADNWTQILTRPDVKVGLADPRLDAAGYRTLMVFKLAEKVYPQPEDLFNTMFDRQFTEPLKVSQDGGVITVRVPEILETTSNAHIVLRGASMAVVALLQSGDVDYMFEYESVIQQDGLRLVHLPDSLNLGAASQSAGYGRVAVSLDFHRFASVQPVFKGEQIAYGITIPTNAPNPQAAALFVAFLLGPDGRQIMNADHHPMLDPVVADGYARLPPELQKLCEAGP